MGKTADTDPAVGFPPRGQAADKRCIYASGKEHQRWFRYSGTTVFLWREVRKKREVLLFLRRASGRTTACESRFHFHKIPRQEDKDERSFRIILWFQYQRTDSFPEKVLPVSICNPVIPPGNLLAAYSVLSVSVLINCQNIPKIMAKTYQVSNIIHKKIKKTVFFLEIISYNGNSDMIILS